jgi:arylsulfatase A-like enzyme
MLLAAACELVWGQTAGPESGTAQTRTPAARLNVVLIVADDLGFGELGCYGQTKIRTPNLDRLASQGLRFTQFYAGAATCAPSRCCLLTGLHSGHAEIRANKAAGAGNKPADVGEFPIRDEAVTLAEVFRAAGYATGAFGKWGLGPINSSGAPHRQGFDVFFGYTSQAAAHSYFPPHLWRNETLVPLNDPPVPGHAKQPEGEVVAEHWLGKRYAPDSMLVEATDFIRRNRDEPFFLYLPFIEPHVALHPPTRLVESYPGRWDDRPYRGGNGYLPHPRPRAAYAALITSLDEHVGRILETLDESGLTDKTLVVFTSDNGTTHSADKEPGFDIGGVDADFFNSVAGLRGRKGSLYEGGIRVPLIVRWPGRIAPNGQTDFASYAPDLFPTLCAAAEIEGPNGLDGINLVPVLEGSPAIPERNPMVWVFAEYGGQVAVRFGQTKVVRQRLLTERPGTWEVYDLAGDPTESHNLAATQPDAVARAIEIFRREVSENRNFPVPIPEFSPAVGR